MMGEAVSARVASEAAPDEPTREMAAPVGTSPDRIASLDFIRGIAVMGILAANIVAFGQPSAAYFWPGAFLTPHGATSDWLWVAQFVLIDGKMRGLFTVLFGAGIILFLQKAWERGSGRWLQLRRLAWLLVFGLVHFFFIWKGDILAGYAIVGAVSLMFVNMKPAGQLAFALIGYVLGAIMWASLFGGMYAFMQTDAADNSSIAVAQAEMATMQTGTLADDALEIPLIQGGDYAGFVAHNFSDHGSDPLFFVFQIFLETLPLMLIGMALYRMGLFSGQLNARKQRLWGWAGVLAGSALNLAGGLWAYGEGLGYFATVLAFIGLAPFGNVLVVIGLASLLSLYAPRVTGWLYQRLSAAGRAAFTNYLGTSILMMFVFHGWALGLFGQLNRPQLYLVVLAAWAVMLLWSKPWLERFRYGPLEWLWRCLTYWTVFPLRR